MQRLILSVAALALAAGLAATSAVAQPGAAPSPKALALARRYVAAAQAGKILQDEAPAVAQFIISRMAPPPGGDAKASEVKHAMLDAADAAVQAKLPDFLDKTAEIYARVFSEQELEAIVGFYDSPAGKAFVTKGQTAAAPMADLIHTLGGEIQQDTEQRFCLKEADLCQKAPPPKAS